MAHSSWGPGWPQCSSSRINRGFYVNTKQGRITFPGGIRHELTELVSRLVRETVNRGYRFGVPGNPSYGCWGYNCRAIGGTRKASNHSWGLAVDINAPTNPMRRPLTTDMPGWMPNLWNAYGFRWGGDYSTTPDAMHYEFMGSVADAAAQTRHAQKNNLGGGGAVLPKPPPPKPPVDAVEDDDMAYLIQGDKTSHWWMTDLATKWHVKNQTIANNMIVLGAKHGPNNTPLKIAQEAVDAIPRSDQME